MRFLLFTPVLVSLQVEDARLSVTDDCLTLAYGDLSAQGARHAWRDFAVEIRDKRRAVVKAGVEYILETHRVKGEAEDKLESLKAVLSMPAKLQLHDRMPTYSGAPIAERVTIELTDPEREGSPVGVLVQRGLSDTTRVEGTGTWLSLPTLQYENRVLCITSPQEPLKLSLGVEASSPELTALGFIER